jgi:endonuclease/exonuclease/phosphatase family metal-dependent hydrolase
MRKQQIALLTGMNLRTLILTILSGISFNCLPGQSLPIAIDGQFDDWMDAATGYTDQQGDGTSLDLLQFEVANDENYLFLRFILDQEIILTENNSLTLFLDTDQNNLTGKVINGIGAELEIRFGAKEAKFYSGNSSVFLDLYEIKFRHQPTVSSQVFELAIGREIMVDGVQPLFSGDNIRFFFQNGTSGDMMPNAGQSSSYTFDNFPAPAYQPIDLQKDKPSYLRLLTWNTLSNGLADLSRRDYFKRIIFVLKPDIVTFNECWDVPPGMAATLMNEAVPLGNFQSWKAVKLDEGNITVSRYPILQNWLFYPGHRLTASLIDLPDNLYNTNLLVINGHLKCCSEGNETRQLEADAFTAFIRDAKTPGGVITLPEGTPFVLSGDLNLVGWQQQLTTLLTGDIVHQSTFGQGGLPDWDDTPLQDVISLQADQRMAYTWFSSNSEFPPSRIDYHISSNSVMKVKKAFILETGAMPPERLAFYGLQKEDTRAASDHLPKVTDFELDATTSTTHIWKNGLDWNVSPNPASEYVHIHYYLEASALMDWAILGADGRTVSQWQSGGLAGQNEEWLDISNLQPGVYALKALTNNAFGIMMIHKYE